MSNKDYSKPMVAIRCIAYNHEGYIRDCLEGIVKQRTDFPFVAIVHDDASTDGTADIIREYAAKYPDIIHPIYETENQYSKRNGSLRRVMDAAIEATGAKYVAFCEGDDYWTDPLKLQKQVDFLETHGDFGMTFSKCERFDQDTLTVKDIWGAEANLNSLLRINTISTPTVCLRADIFKQYIAEIEPGSHGWKMGDLPMWLYFAGKSKIYFHKDEIFARYRILKKSASHFDELKAKLQFWQSGITIQKFFADKFDVNRLTTEFMLGMIECQLALVTGDESLKKKSLNTIKNINDIGEISMKERVRFKFVKSFPILYAKIQNYRLKRSLNS